MDYLLDSNDWQSTAELIWAGREGQLVFLDTLKEAHLHFLEGMRNGLWICAWILGILSNCVC